MKRKDFYLVKQINDDLERVDCALASFKNYDNSKKEQNRIEIEFRFGGKSNFATVYTKLVIDLLKAEKEDLELSLESLGVKLA